MYFLIPQSVQATSSPMHILGKQLHFADWKFQELTFYLLIFVGLFHGTLQHGRRLILASIIGIYGKIFRFETV